MQTGVMMVSRSASCRYYGHRQLATAHRHRCRCTHLAHEHLIPAPPIPPAPPRHRRGSCLRRTPHVWSLSGLDGLTVQIPDSRRKPARFRSWARDRPWPDASGEAPLPRSAFERRADATSTVSRCSGGHALPAIEATRTLRAALATAQPVIPALVASSPAAAASEAPRPPVPKAASGTISPVPARSSATAAQELGMVMLRIVSPRGRPQP